MAQQKQSRSSSGSGDWVFIILVVALAVVWLKWGQNWLNGVSSQTAGRIQELMPGIIAGVVLLVAAMVYRSLLTGRRRKRKEMISSVLVDLLPKTYDPATGLTVSWKPFTAKVKKVNLRYPPESNDRDPEWKMKVVDAISYRAALEAWKTQWNQKTTSVTLVSVKPEPDVPPTDDEINRSAILTRVHLTIAPLFGSDIKVSIPEWTNEPSDPPGGYPLRIEVTYPPTTRDASAQWRRRLEAVVSVKVPPGNARWLASYQTAADKIVLAHRPALPTALTHPGVATWANNDGILLPYGVDERGEVAAWAITGKESKTRPTVHTLVIGATGTGKTSVMRSLLTAATAQGIRVLGGDPKRIELTPFRGWPGVEAIASTPEDIGLLILATHNLMEHRYEIIESGRGTADSMEDVLLFLDELLILKSSLDRWWNQHKGDEGIAEIWGTKTGTHHPAMSLLTNLLALARSARIRIVEGVQRPDASLFEDGARDNLRHRISMGRLSREGAEMLWGDSWTGTDTPMISGRAIASPDGGEGRETQMYWTPDARTTIPADKVLIDELRAAAEVAFTDRGPLEGLDLSALSDVARSIPEGPADDVVVLGEVVEHSPELSTQTVFADAIMPGDRYVYEDQVFTVAAVEPVQNPDDPDIFDYLEITATGPAGPMVEEVPSDATYDRVIEIAE